MSSIPSYKIFAPATVANVGSGFDIFSFAVSQPGDIIEFKPRHDSELVIENKTDNFPKIPLKAVENVTSFTMSRLLRDKGSTQGFDIIFHQKIRPGSGLGSSAASSCAGLFYLNSALELGMSTNELIDYAREGERLACGSPIADNVSSCMNGGFNLIRSQDPLDIVSIDFPKDLFVVCVHPEIEVLTQDARNVIPESIPLKIATAQWSQTAAMVAGLYQKDFDLIARATEDLVVEPHRKDLIKGFDEVKKAVLQNGGLNCSISGAGPTLFSFCRNKNDAERIAQIMFETFHYLSINSDVYVNTIDPQGIKILED